MPAVSSASGDGPSRPPSYSALPTASRTHQVREQLEAAIARGDYVPGDRLPSERELVELLGVSRVSVREAIRALEAVGMIEVRHGRGCFVARTAPEQYASSFSRWLAVHSDEIFELLKVRGALDELAAELAASAGAGTWPPRLREINEAFRQVGNDDIDALVARDVEFHDGLAEASGSPLLADLLRDLHEVFNESRRATLQPPWRPAESAREHDQIIDAIEQRDPAAARAAVAAHLSSVRRSITTILENQEAEENVK